jgi:hypothetical protein
MLGVSADALAPSMATLPFSTSAERRIRGRTGAVTNAKGLAEARPSLTPYVIVNDRRTATEE